jgi:predicted cytidylate kinase
MAPFPATPRSRKHQIAINGSLGSGKTTVGKKLAEATKWEYHSTGSVQRNIAQAMGLSTLELNHIAETDQSIDERIDSVFKSLSSKENIIIDSRMAWHFLPESYRVRLVVSPEEAADRVLRDTDRDAEKYASSLVAIRDIEARTKSERKRFLNTYQVDVTDLNNYDLVVDTEFLAPESVTELVLSCFTLWKFRVNFPSALISPKVAIPSSSVSQLDTRVVADLVDRYSREGVSSRPKVLYFRGRHIILENHEAFCAAIRADVTALPVQIITDAPGISINGLSADQFVRESVNVAQLYDWEEACGIKFVNRPSWLDH